MIKKLVVSTIFASALALAPVMAHAQTEKPATETAKPAKVHHVVKHHVVKHHVVKHHVIHRHVIHHHKVLHPKVHHKVHHAKPKAPAKTETPAK